MTTISLCMIVRNEQKYLPGCLKSVKGVVDEIVVVDTGSTDLTVQIAEQFGARVFRHEWKDNFSEARNFSLEMASGDWILVLDADEELPPETRDRVKGLIDSTAADGIEVTVKSEMPEEDILRHDDSRIVRLFRRRDEYRYVMPVHEQIRQSIENHGGKIAISDLVILHHGYAAKRVQAGDKDQGEKRVDRNLRILNYALSTSPDDPYLSYQLAATLMSVGRRNDAFKEFMRVLSLDYERLGPSILDKLFMKISQLFLERNKYDEAIEFAEKSLGYNPNNVISQYVAAVGHLSCGRIDKGYDYLLKIRDNHGGTLRLGAKLEELIIACEKTLMGPS
jgi:glycosyltransferase involved in cell wall biosynthesis